MAFEGSSQRNEFHGDLSNERGLFMAGAQLSTGVGNIIIYGAGGLPPHAGGVRDDGGKHISGAAKLLVSEGLCVLCIGGGVNHGLAALHLLRDMMADLNVERQKAHLPSVRAWEVFDLVAGTAEGGFISFMLGRLQMTVEDCIAAYSCLVRNKATDTMPNTALETTLREIITKSGQSLAEPFCGAARSGSKVVVFRTVKDSIATMRLRSYSAASSGDSSHTLWDAVMAALAESALSPAPWQAGEPESAALGGRALVDETVKESLAVWHLRKEQLAPLALCYVSITAKEPRKRRADDQFAEPTSLVPDERFFRFELERTLTGDGLAANKLLAAIQKAADDFLDEHRTIVRHCVLALKWKLRKTDATFCDRMENIDRVTNLQLPSEVTPSCWSVPFDRNPRFVGRSTLLAELETKLAPSGRFKKAAVVGLGGIGKTQLALELAYRTRDKSPGSSVFWVPALSRDTVRKAFIDMGRQLKVPGLEEPAADVFGLVQQRLSLESTGQWLLIVDNADDGEVWFEPFDSSAPSARLIDFLPRSTRGAMLITTRSRKVAVQMAGSDIFTVPEMDEPTATDLLRKALIAPQLMDNEETMRALLTRLTFLPLAINQAAAYINANDVSIAEYQSLLSEADDTAIELLSEHFDDEGRYREAKNPIASTWLISFEHIRRHDLLAADYLSFMACVEPKLIPQSLLPEATSSKKALDAIGTLTAYSFVTKRPGGKYYDMHRLVHLAMRNWLAKEQLLAKWNDQALARLADVFPDPYPVQRDIWRALLPHARAVIAENRWVKFDNASLQLLCRYADCLSEEGRYAEAMQIYLQRLKLAKEHLEHEHPETLRSMSRLASLYLDQGRWTEAEDLGMQVVKMMKRVLGHEHPETIQITAHLAVTYLKQGRLAEAEETENEVLKIGMRVLGPEHPQMLICKGNLASAYRGQGRWKEAEELGMQVLEMMKRVYGQEHPVTLRAMMSLAATHSMQGHLTEAEVMENHVLEIRKRVLGHEHPDTLSAMANLATTYSGQGRRKDAAQLRLQVLEIRKKVLGLQHPDTLTGMTNLTLSYCDLGRWGEAEKLGTQVLSTMKKALGQEHPTTLTCMTNLATVYARQGRWAESEQLETEALEVRKRVLGRENPETLMVMGNLAVTYMRQGRWKEAGELGLLVLEIRRRVLGQEHPDTLASMANLATAYGNLGRREEALELETKLLKTRKSVLGDEHPDTLLTMGNLAMTYLGQGRWDEAEELGLGVLEIRKSVQGLEHPETLTCMANLATIYWNQSRLAEAEELEKEVLEVRKRLLGQEHPETLLSMANLAHTWRSQGRHSEALSLMRECFESQKQKLGVNHPHTIASGDAINLWLSARSQSHGL